MDNEREKTETVQDQDQDHHVERNKQTNHNQACHLHPEIHHHSWVCMYPLSSCVRSFVRSFVHASVIISQERKKEEGSKSTRPTEALDRDNN